MKTSVQRWVFGSFKTLLLCALLGCLPMPTAAQAQEVDTADFIDGFPDVPVLASVKALLGDPVVFDTPSGTVAEASLSLSEPFVRVARQYNAALSSLGWRCAGYRNGLLCRREDSKLTVSSGSADEDSLTMSLRLEPS